MNFKFTIITVCYNSIKQLKKTVKSVQMQQFENYEYIIVDGESNDGTREYLAEEEIKCELQYIREPDTGLYDAMNKAIRHSRGEFLYFLNAGDTFIDEMVLETLSKVCNMPNTVYYGTSKAIYADGTVRSNRIYTRLYKKIKYDVFNGRMPNHQAIVAHKNCFQNNYFDTTYELGADFKWFALCVKRKMKVEKIDVCIANFEIGGKSSRPQGRRKMLEEYECILKKLFPLEYPIFEIRNLPNIRNEKNKYMSLFSVLEQWMAAKQNGKRLDLYLTNKGYRTVAVYGMSVLGNLLYNELKDSSIKVLCGIDRNAHDMSFDFEVYNLEEFKEHEMKNVDLVIVSAIISKNQVKEITDKIVCDVITIDDIVYGIFEE